MAGTRKDSECAQEVIETELGDYGSANSTPPVARVAVHAATLAAALEGLVALVAASIIGWALTISPAGGTVPLHALRASSDVVDLVGLALRASTYASVLLAVCLLIAGGVIVRWRHTALDHATTDGAGGPAFVPCWLTWVALVVLRGGVSLGTTASGVGTTLNTVLAQQLATVVLDVGLMVGSVLLARLMARSSTGSDPDGHRLR
ncbi:MAG TPA: hypothetical protein VIT20_03925 [Propionibacteriaceae bacterium]